MTTAIPPEKTEAYMLESEATIQSWFESLCRGEGIPSYIVNREAVAEALEQSSAQDAPFSLDQTVREALLRSAYSVLQRLDHAELVTCNQNISRFPDDELKPDLVLMDRENGAFVVIELKKSHQTARQAITELVAYGQAIEHLYPSSQISLVLVSPDWRPLLDYAVVNQVTTGRRKLLALEIATCNNSQFTLRVRVDALLRNINDLVFQPKSLPAETITFERRAYPLHRDCPLEVTSSFSAIAREGDRSGGTGFALLWRSRSEYGFQWHITVMALDPFRLAVEPHDASPQWCHPIAAFVRGERRPDGTPMQEQDPTLSVDEDLIPWGSAPQPPDPGAAMGLIDEVYADISDSLVRSHDNQLHWAYVQSEPFHASGIYLAFEAWGILGDLVRNNGKRFWQFGDLLSRQNISRVHWNAPANWVPCIDIVTGEDPLRDNLMTVSSCHALGVVFRKWIDCSNANELSLSRTMANARIIRAMRKVAAICQNNPDLAAELPFVQIYGTTPSLHDVLDHVDWISNNFFPDCWLQFAFHLGYQVPQESRYVSNSGLVTMPIGEESMLSQVNLMLEKARSSRPPQPPGSYQNEAEYELEIHLQGRPMKSSDLVNGKIRACFLEVVTPHFSRSPHPATTSQIRVEV
jgi:hypothetical protein